MGLFQDFISKQGTNVTKQIIADALTTEAQKSTTITGITTAFKEDDVKIITKTRTSVKFTVTKKGLTKTVSITGMGQMTTAEKNAVAAFFTKIKSTDVFDKLDKTGLPSSINDAAIRAI